MIDLDALKAAGLTNKFLKDVMCAEPDAKPAPKKSRGRGDTKDETATTSMDALNRLERLPKNPSRWDVRCHLETLILGEMEEGQQRCVEHFNKWAAIDLAYASIPIHPVTLPLMQVAMGHVTLDACREDIGKMSTTLKRDLFEQDRRGRVTGVKTPKLIEVSHNLVHSLTTRRVAALATEIYQQYPLSTYNPFSNTQVGRLTGDLMTQLAEQMAGAYGYRKDAEESIRQATLYTDCIKFKAKAWHTERQTLPKVSTANGAKKAGRPAKKEFERRIIREGVLFTIPHPSRRYYDISQPASKINQGLGPRWGGHWEAVPIGVIRNDPAYFNRDKIVMDADMFSVFRENTAYFAQYYKQLSVPDPQKLNASMLALGNDRNARIGSWAALNDETATVLTNHYKQVIPKNVGLGTYEDPIWIRFVMAGNTTCVYAEIVGSEPWSINSYNATDGLVVSPSFGSQAIQWQQMLTNQLTELLHVQAQGLVRIWALNTHGMKKEEIEAVESAIKNPDFAELKDIIIKYDSEKFAQRGADATAIKDKITQIRIETASKVSEIFQNMMNTLALAERIMFFSPQELGQVSARTTSATEQKAIRDTTLGIRDFHLIGIKQQLEADKRIIHDSYMAFGSEDLELPVAERYEQKVIEAAGFEIVDDGSGNPPDGLYTLRGKKLGLFYNYTFSTRTTDDTPPDAAVAQGISQVYDILSKDQILSENTTLEQRMELANSLFGILSGGIFKLRVPPGVDGKKTGASVVSQMQAQLQQLLPQLGKAIEGIQQKQQQQAQQIEETNAGISALSQALARISSVIEKTAPPARGAAPVRGIPRGRVSATTAEGAGAPPLRGVPRPLSVPLIGG